MLMLNRAFFSLQENWFPTAVALGNLALNALLDLAFYRFGTWGIPLATAVSNVFATAALLVLLRRRLGRIGGAAITFSLLKIIAASAVVALLSYAVWRPLDEALGRSFPAQAVSLGLALAVATAGYLAACRALRVREMQALLSLRGRFARS
jgi:putative peptidoglycan lipid II flippase